MLTPSPAAITFDCWNTLIFESDVSAVRNSRVALLGELLRAAGHDFTAKQIEGAIRESRYQHDKAWLRGVETGADAMMAATLDVLDVRDLALVAELVPRLQALALDSPVTALDGARTTLERLAARGTRLALVCDTGFLSGNIVRQLLDREGLLAPLEVTIFSNEIGVPKPDARTFGAALDGLGVAPRDAVHVGDLKRTDVAGAREFGMGTIRIADTYNDADEPLPEADWVVDSHHALQALVGL